jgi:Zn finger protein HypA/HybF involved in hydrogenase expression
MIRPPGGYYCATLQRAITMTETEFPYCPRCSEERLRVNEMDLLECPHCHTQAQRIDRDGSLHVLADRGEGRFKDSASSGL